MEDDAAARSSGGLTALSHRLMTKLSSSSSTADRPAAKGDPTKSGNLVFSPVSIYSALSLAAAGARGKTLTELLDALGAKSRESLAESVRSVVERALPDGSPRRGGGGPRVAHACGVWHDATLRLKPSYRAVAAASCNAVVNAVDFITKPEEALKLINSWVAKKTSNLIDSVLRAGQVQSDTRLVVATAIYFKGIWETPFDKSLTKEHKFHRLDGGVTDAQFMRSYTDQFIATYKGFKVLRMPYAAHDPFGGFRAMASAVVPRAVSQPPEYSMCVFLPDAHDGLRSLEEEIAASGPGFLAEHMPRSRVEVGDFRVPKFKLSFYDSLKRVLEDLGVKTVFVPFRAELPDMVEGSAEPLYLGDVFHRAVIEVNEDGTEAAASTALLFRATACGPGFQPPKPVDFVADHPFAFFVVEEVSGAILFAGHVLDPTKF